MGFLDHAGLAHFWEKVKAALGLKMDKSVYDPTGKGEDVFGYVDAVANDVFTEITDHCVLLLRANASLPVSGNWPSITYGNGKFVVTIGNSGKSAYSPDGLDWTESPIPLSANWTSIIYSGGIFVAVANVSEQSIYSLDGITWTEASMPCFANWASVTYGNGKFVAVAGNSDKAAYSLDGVTWQATALPYSAPWTSITYGNGKFIAVSYINVKSVYSLDGINWAESVMPISANWSSVTYGNGKFVAVANDSDKAAYSLDGIIWAETPMPYSANWASVTYGNGKFVAVAGNSDKAAYSLDGITWTQVTMPSSQRWCSIVCGGDRFVAVASASTRVAYSLDGVTWYDGKTVYADSAGNELTGFDPGPLTAADVGADPAGTAAAAVAALPVKKLVGTAEKPIDLDTLTEPGRYYIEGTLVEKEGPEWSTTKMYLSYGIPLDVMKPSVDYILQMLTVRFSFLGRDAHMDEQGVFQWGGFEKNEVAVASYSVSATLFSSAWTGAAAPYTQTVSVDGIYSNTNGDLGLDQDVTPEQRAAAREAMLCVTGQASDSLTVTADGVKPTVDIPVTITILG